MFFLRRFCLLFLGCCFLMGGKDALQERPQSGQDSGTDFFWYRHILFLLDADRPGIGNCKVLAEILGYKLVEGYTISLVTVAVSLVIGLDVITPHFLLVVLAADISGDDKLRPLLAILRRYARNLGVRHCHTLWDGVLGVIYVSPAVLLLFLGMLLSLLLLLDQLLILFI